jgi:hypothetical protein
MRTLSPLRRTILVVGGLLSLGVITVAVLSIVDWMARTTYEQNTAVATSGQRLVVHNNPGDIDVTPSTDGQVHVRLQVRYGLYRPSITQESTADGITLGAHCRGWVVGVNGCSVRYSVAVPPAFTVEVVASAGDISATGLTGQVSLISSAGDIRATGLSGTLTMRTSAGDVRGTELRDGEVHARTSAGDVDLAFAEAPRDVTAQSSAGDVDVALPTGELYLVDVRSSAGDEYVDPAMRSPESARTVTATTSAGDVTVHRTAG